MRTLILCFKGGPGSGFEDHAGRPGKQGGSAPEVGNSSTKSFYDDENNRKGVENFINHKSISSEMHKVILNASLDNKTKYPTLTRAENDDRRHEVYEKVYFKNNSFSGLNFDKGETASTLRTDYAHAFYKIDKSTHGLDVDYSKMKFQDIAGLSGEQESIVSGAYIVKKITKTVDGYPVYHLKESDDLDNLHGDRRLEVLDDLYSDQFPESDN